MNFDYLELSRSLDKDKPCLDYLDWQYSNKTGWNMFHFEGCKCVEIWLNPEATYMKIRGSFPYFFAGQNFDTRLQDFKKGIDYLASILELNLYHSEVKTFEYGTTLKLPFLPKHLFDSHLKIKGMKSISLPYGKYFEDQVLRLKMYDAGYNIKKKLDKQERERLQINFNYDSKGHYLKLEHHYKKPSIYFKQRSIQLLDLLEEPFQAMCKNDLLQKYNSILKTTEMKITDKKNLSSSTLPLLILKEYEALLPKNAEELIKQKIRSFPLEVLSKEDKKSRVRQLRSNFQKIQSMNKCEYDISNLLKEKVQK